VPLVVKLVDEMEPQFSPDGELSVKVSGPTNPRSKVIVIVDLADEPTFAGEGEVAVIVKSGGLP